MQSVCIYCGSSTGNRPEYRETAISTGKLLAERGITLVYGGGRVGLMGIVADAALQAGGKVIGVIPNALSSDEIAHSGLTELHVVRNMHERKAQMADLSDAFIALPGGLGTLDELFEIWTWRQLKMHQKPIGLVNVAGFFDPLLEYLNNAVVSGFVKAKHREILQVADHVEDLLSAMNIAGQANCRS